MTRPTPSVSYGQVVVKSWSADSIPVLVPIIQAWLDAEQGLLLQDLTHLLHMDLQTLTLRAMFVRTGADLGYFYRVVGVTGVTLDEARAALAAHYAAYPNDRVVASISLPGRAGVTGTGSIHQLWFFINGDAGLGFCGPADVWVAEPVDDIDPETLGEVAIWDASGNPLDSTQQVYNASPVNVWPAGQRSLAIWDWGTGSLIALPTGQDESGGSVIANPYIYPLCIRGAPV
jgi:hypothetical protein